MAAFLRALSSAALGFSSMHDTCSKEDTGQNDGGPLAGTIIVLLACLYTGCTSRYQGSDGEINLGWSSALTSLQVKAEGALEFTEDQTDIRSITPKGYLLIKERRGLTVRKFEAVQGPDGTLTRSYYLRGRPRQMDEEARAWLARVLPEVIDGTGIGASTRAQKLLKQRGTPGVLEEIAHLKSDRIKVLYFKELFQSGNLSSQELQQAAQQVSRQISSDGEKASLLSEVADLYVMNPAARSDFFGAVQTIGSDGEREGLLSGLLTRKGFSQELLIQVLKSAANITSDGEKASVLVKAAEHCPADDNVLSEYLRTAVTISSDGEKSRVLSALLKKQGLSNEILVKTLNATATISSDGEKAAVLEEVVQIRPNHETVLSAYLATAGSISSAGERGRVLTVLLGRGDLSQQDLRQVLESAAGIASDGEKAAVLEQAAKFCSNDDTLLTAFLAATETLSSDGEYRRLISTLMNQIKPRALSRSPR